MIPKAAYRLLPQAIISVTFSLLLGAAPLFADDFDVSSIQRVDNKPSIPHVAIVLYASDGTVVPNDMHIYIYDADAGPNAPLVEITVGEYLAELNDTERELNKMGRTLRSLADFGLLTTVPIDRPALAAQGILIDEGQRLFDETVMQNILDGQTLDQLINDAATSADDFTLADISRLAAQSIEPALDLPETSPLNTIIPQTKIDAPKFKAEKQRTWGFAQGDPQSFQVSGQAQIKANGLATGSRSSRGQVNAHLAANVFGSSAWYLAKGFSDYNAPEHGMQKATTYFEILGVEVYRKEKEHARLKWGDRYTKSVGKENKYPFMIGFVPCEATIGVRGEAYFSWSLGLSPLTAYGQALAGARVDAYASVAAQLYVLEAGVRGELNLVRDEFVLDGNVRLTLDEQDVPSLTLDINAENTISALSGRLFAYATARYTECVGGDFAGISYPKCGYNKKTWEQDFFDWSGFEDRGNILSLHYVLSPYGSKVSGKDASAEEFREIAEMATIADAVTSAQRENAVITAENKLSLKRSDFFLKLHQDLGSTAATQSAAILDALNTQRTQLTAAVDTYLAGLQ